MNGAHARVRLIGVVLLAAMLLGGMALTRLGLADAAAWARTLAETAQALGPLGWLAFAVAQTAVAMLGVIPASLLGVAAGAVYGPWLGFLLSAIGTLAGGWLAFRLARSLLRPLVARRLAGRRLAGLDAAVASDGWRFVCLLRVSPVMPFAVTSYALGLTRIRGRDYALGSLAALPALAAYVGLGGLARQGVMETALTAENLPGQVLFGLGALATIALLLRSGWLLARCGLLPARTQGAGPPPAPSST